MTPKCIVIDFETYRIQGRPHYPPRPVGVAIKWPGEPSRYYAFGHASENNCTEADARIALRRAFESDYFLLFHNAKFDIEVAMKWAGITWNDDELVWNRIHDTAFLAFLCDPHALSHGLKELATQHLNWPPDEKDAVGVWVWERRHALEHTTGRKVNRTKRGEVVVASNAFEFMEFVPGDIAGVYACGDVDRTEALFELMYGYVADNGMLEAYDRERELMPILLENEMDGIRIDVTSLEEDTHTYRAAMDFVEDQLRGRLDAPGLNFDADQEFAHALIRAGIVREDQFERTAARGDYRVGKDALKPHMFSDPLVAQAIGYRNRLKTCLSMFMEPWLAQALERGGMISTNWNQTRGGDGGTRTGRPSTYDPNFLNISKNFEGRPDGYTHPEFLGVPQLPLVRRYMLPDKDHYWLHRDFSGQELRVFAHFEQGALLKAYHEDPALDPHGWVRDMAIAKRPDLAAFDPAKLRTNIKVLNFQRIYGGGVGACARSLGISEAEAKEFLKMHDEALPGRKALNDEIIRTVKMGEPIRTWGGRLYYPEEPRFVDGRLMSFEYKLLNYLVQGSAADLTKQAIIDWYNHPDRQSRFLVTVYDEINVSAPKEIWQPQMKLLREVMCAPRLDCPMLSDGKYGPRWGELEKCE